MAIFSSGQIWRRLNAKGISRKVVKGRFLRSTENSGVMLPMLPFFSVYIEHRCPKMENMSVKHAETKVGWKASSLKRFQCAKLLAQKAVLHTHA